MHIHDPRILWHLIRMTSGRTGISVSRQDIAMHYLECYPFDESVSTRRCPGRRLRASQAMLLSRQYVSDALRRLRERGMVEQPVHEGLVLRGYWQLCPINPLLREQYGIELRNGAMVMEKPK